MLLKDYIADSRFTWIFILHMHQPWAWADRYTEMEGIMVGVVDIGIGAR